MTLKFDKFDVEFDDNRTVFFAGQVVSGRIICHVSDAMTIRGIKLKMVGSANVEWSEKTNDGYRTYSNSEQYFVHKANLFGQGDKSELSAGEHAFEFSAQLPIDCPSSFEGHHGSVRYYARATADAPGKSDVSCQRMFSVNAVADLNVMEGADVKVEKEKSKFICCLCCESGPIEARCWLEHPAYVPGENLLFSAEIINRSNAGSISSSIRLVQSIVYHANAKQRTIDTVISEASRPSFRREDYWSDFRLPIPALPPSPFKSCKIITIDYYLQFSVNPGLFSVSQKFRLPVMIGTVPLRIEGHFNRFQEAPASAGPTIPLPAGYDDLPLPTFDAYPFEAIHSQKAGDESTKDAMINVLGFKPMYVFYHSTPPPGNQPQ